MCSLIIGRFLTAGNSLFAQVQQTDAESTLSPKFGIKGGLNLTNMYVKDVSDENMKVGWNAGFYAKLPVTRGFSIQPELIYTSKGAKETYNNFIEGKGEYRFNLNYIELPLLAVSMWPKISIFMLAHMFLTWLVLTSKT